MPDPLTFVERMKKGLLSIEQQVPGGCDEEALEPLYLSLERTIARLAPGNSLTPAAFRFQVTGGKALLFQGNEALPLEPTRLLQLLNAIQLNLQPGEILELDGALAAWLLRPEINVTDTNLRQADTSLRTIKTGRDRDHAAAQSAESTKVRLRSRLTQLVSALQSAQRETEKNSSTPNGPLKPPGESTPAS